jgi:methylmalonyl-CoA/ethylmalonyl-CoA epimerase
MSRLLYGRPVHHVGLVVPDITAAIEHAESVYGLQLIDLGPGLSAWLDHGRRIEPHTHVALSAGGPPHLELLQAVPGTVWQVLPGLHHVGYVVDDLPSAADELAAAGLPVVLEDVNDTGRPIRATYHRDPLGPIVELMSELTAGRMRTHLATALRG